MMKILFITNAFNPPRSTGSANSSSLIYKGLIERNHDLDLLIFDRAEFIEDYRECGLGNFYKKNDFLNVLSELKRIEDGVYEIIHLYGGGWQKFILPYLCKNFKKTKIVTTQNGICPVCWNFEAYEKYDNKCCSFSKSLRCLIKKRSIHMKWFSILEYFVRKLQLHSFRYYDKYFAQSETINQLLTNAGIDSSKVEIIPNFFDPDFYKKIKEKEKKNTEKTIILFVGYIRRRKGLDKLIKAFKKIHSNKIELRIVGDGSGKEEAKKLAGNDKGIKFLGHIPYKSDELIETYIDADIFVHPGIWPEPFNRTILEAAISKNAIIVSDIGAPPEVLEDKALIYDPHDIKGLVDCLKELINNPEKRKKMEQEVHDYIFEEYSLESAIDRLEQEYKKLLKT